MKAIPHKPSPRPDGAPWVWWSAERKWIAVSPDVQLIRSLVSDGKLDSDLVTCAGGPEGKNKRCRYLGTGIRHCIACRKDYDKRRGPRGSAFWKKVNKKRRAKDVR